MVELPASLMAPLPTAMADPVTNTVAAPAESADRRRVLAVTIALAATVEMAAMALAATPLCPERQGGVMVDAAAALAAVAADSSAAAAAVPAVRAGLTTAQKLAAVAGALT